MQQLVELQKHAETFQRLNAELVFVFREESLGVNGLKKIKAKHRTTYTLALDNQKKTSASYSPKAMTFDNYVINSDGVVVKIISGSLRKRADADVLIDALRIVQPADK
ncbi:MAG: peroxiredoxin family protein [Rubripirellula sp.]